MSIALLTGSEAGSHSENNACPDRSASVKGRALFYLDEGLKCLYSTDISLLAEGEYLAPRLAGIARDSAVGEGVFTFCGGEYYAAVLTRSETGYICELFSRDMTEELLCKSQLPASSMPKINEMESAMSELWRSVRSLHRNIFDEKSEEIRRIMYRLTARQRKLTDYARMLSVPAEAELFELCGFCRELADRCNLALEGKRAVLSHCCGEVFAEVDGMNAATALTHLIQNALWYSEKDCMPDVAVTCEDRGGVTAAVIRVSNAAKRRLSAADITVRQQAGTGIRLARRFAEMEGGSFGLILHGDTVTAEMSIPALPKEKAAGKRRGALSEVLADNGSGIPDIVRIMMFEQADGEEILSDNGQLIIDNE